jgi:CheY-like chemotaxis protein
MKTILQIEDNLASQVLTERVLSSHGYRLVVASDGESGIQMALEAAPDLILVDLGLPDLDGQTVATLLRQIPELKKVPIVALTAYPPDKAQETADRYGLDGCLTKPIDVRDFPGQIERFLAARR